ncbi:hypothetical protein [Paraburkholderia terrae]|uniref:DUF4148 domain-containing protein n=1 Tax=Paraburkholderia terrae TaxID=311230 RepID=A0A2I8ETX7_9BURK|nr:hypothetical protein [Paraburkholderia terrae]AUT62721.1 hypothetical protein C2L65_24295 [Paraburkholderia terrae]BCZ81631.1 hypothetical protein PTKU64_53060 [Paraburkholderia terrae]BDC42484.1 hypothetical protein PTKU15_57810 [Paraburkholderia terrae]
MSRVLTIAAVVLLAASAGAGAQTKPENASSSNAVKVQSGDAGKSLTEKAQQGEPGNAEGTLMNKRSKALSPQGASAAGKTGEVKQ